MILKTKSSYDAIVCSELQYGCDMRPPKAMDVHTLSVLNQSHLTKLLSVNHKEGVRNVEC